MHQQVGVWLLFQLVCHGTGIFQPYDCLFGKKCENGVIGDLFICIYPDIRYNADLLHLLDRKLA